MPRNIPPTAGTATAIPNFSELKFKMTSQNISAAQFLAGRIDLVTAPTVTPGEVALESYNLVVDTGATNQQIFLPDNTGLDGSEFRIFVKSTATGTLEVLDHSSVSLLTLDPGGRGSFVPFGGEWFSGPF